MRRRIESNRQVDHNRPAFLRLRLPTEPQKGCILIDVRDPPRKCLFARAFDMQRCSGHRLLIIRPDKYSLLHHATGNKGWYVQAGLMNTDQSNRLSRKEHPPRPKPVVNPDDIEARRLRVTSNANGKRSRLPHELSRIPLLRGNEFCNGAEHGWLRSSHHYTRVPTCICARSRWRWIVPVVSSATRQLPFSQCAPGVMGQTKRANPDLAQKTLRLASNGRFGKADPLPMGSSLLSSRAPPEKSSPCCGRFARKPLGKKLENRTPSLPINSRILLT